jgi:hypothetical protein
MRKILSSLSQYLADEDQTCVRDPKPKPDADRVLAVDNGHGCHEI